MCLPTCPSPRLPDYRPRPAALVPGPPSHRISTHRTYVPPVSQPANFDVMPYRLAAQHACLPAIRAAGRPLRERSCTVSGSAIVPCPRQLAHADRSVVVHTHTDQHGGPRLVLLLAFDISKTTQYQLESPARPPPYQPRGRRPSPGPSYRGRAIAPAQTRRTSTLWKRGRKGPQGREERTLQTPAAVSGGISRPHSLETPMCVPAVCAGGAACRVVRRPAPAAVVRGRRSCSVRRDVHFAHEIKYLSSAPSA